MMTALRPHQRHNSGQVNNQFDGKQIHFSNYCEKAGLVMLKSLQEELQKTNFPSSH